jgi:P-type conjugative transfer protein TrbG
MFKRPAVHYGKTPPTETPYQRAAQVWDDRIGSARVQARNWRLAFFGALALSGGLAAGLTWTTARGSIVPWVVEVDRLGEAKVVAPAAAGYHPTDPQIAYHLARFIEDVRSVPSDPVIVRQDWLRAYDFTTNQGARALNEYARANDPFAAVGKVQVDPRIAQQLPHRLDRAPLRRRRPGVDRPLVSHCRRRPAAADHPRGPEEEPPRRLRHRHQLVEGTGFMTASHSLLSRLAVLMASVSTVAACAGAPKPPVISYDDPQPIAAVQLADPPRPVEVVAVPTPLPLPGQLKPLPGTTRKQTEAIDPTRRVEVANAAARIQPDRGGFLNAIQQYPYSDGALYQVYAAPGQVTDIALEPGEALVGSGPVAAGDTVRWIIGDTTSGSGLSRRVHILLKPTLKDITTNLVINTDRRTYHLELRATPATYMASVSWTYPQDQLIALRGQNSAADQAQPVAGGIDISALHFRYAISGDETPWRPVRAFDDGTKVYIEFPAGIGQGEMPPLFVIGPAGGGELVNYRVAGRHMIVDRLFGAAELTMGDKTSQKTVRITRTDGRSAR